MLAAKHIPILGFAALSGTGKTTLLTQLLPLFAARGIRVGMIKHAHHNFDIDQPGKDSYELRKAGAAQMLVASDRRWALMVENPQDAEPRLNELIARLEQDTLDLILVEGFKHEPFAKIELHRRELGHPFLFAQDAGIIAVASDGELPQEANLPRLNISDTQGIFDFIIRHFSL